jgi:non-ribosomal peptide synthase protein (TIGR01720 family)
MDGSNTMSSSISHDMPEGIAIIGMSGRFPGAPDLDTFWKNLCDGVESITFFSNDELVRSISTPPDPDIPTYVKAGPILEDVETFDAAFFGYTPRDAEIIDPQHRLFLECAWEALENAGYDSERYKGWIAVYGGVGLPSYLLNNLYQNNEVRALIAAGSLQVTTANNVDYLATRVSYKLNLKGPSITLQTACSTSLVAIHLACQGLMSYQSDMALAGGVSVRVPQKDGYWYQEGGILSPDGHCRSFDARARGTVFGSGAGMVVLKRLSDALADGDQIHAIIRGSAINNDGSLKVGFTAPGMEGQIAAIAMAQGIAGVDPESISYIEAHGTATSVGDPIEIAALTQVFRAKTQKKGFCAVGSVKSNIGHTNTAAGVAGLIKTVLALKHRTLPPSLHYEVPNPKIDFESSPFFVNTALTDWNGPTPLRAGVSSFGVGGTNAHLVIEEAPPLEPSDPARPWQLVLLSAKTSSALETVTTRLVEHMRQNPDLNLADLAYTLQVGRGGFSYRRVLVCRDSDDAVHALETRDPKRVLSSVHQRGDRPVVFMFSGQGAQYINMARDLYQSEPLFREQVDRCAELLRPHLGRDLREIIYPRDEGRTTNDEGGDSSAAVRHSPDADDPLLNQTQYAQPALFVIEYALAQLWIAWGIRPQAMIGHSIGEYVAACLAGVFSLEDALALVAARGRLMQQLPSGAMLAVPLSEQEIQPLLGDQLGLAAVNGPTRCVVSGPLDAISELERRLAARGVDCRQLHTSHAFHSKMMEPMLEPFLKYVYAARLKAPTIPYISNVTGTWITPQEALTPSYWTQHVRQAVRFGDGLGELLKEPDRLLLEVGAQTLSTLARQYPGRTAGQAVLTTLRHPNDQQSDRAFLLSTLGQLWLAGMSIDWDAIHANERRHRIPLPTYPFERQRYWIEPSESAFEAQPRTATLNKKPNIADWFYIPSWKRSLPPVEPDTSAEQTARWLVFSDASGLGARLATQLGAGGRDVVMVTVGEQFECHHEHSYTLNPRDPEAYDRLLKEVCESSSLPTQIVHLWSVLPDDGPLARDERFEQAQSLGFYSMLYLAQALGRQNQAEPMHITVVSNNMQRVTNEAVLYPEKATLLGPCKVIPQEYPNISCQSIDIELGAPGSTQDELIDQLLAEVAAPAPDPIIAYRAVDRWVQTYEPAPLGEALEGKTRLRAGGVYLITGGLGGIGLVLAEYLAQTIQAKLVLTGRSAFPDREEWGQWLAAHAEQDKISGQIRALRKLEDLGAELLVVSGDASDAASMSQVVRQARERFGAINGVIHSAGVAGGGMIQLKTTEMAARVLAPKVNAIQALEAALAGVALDFLVLCSSTTAIIGGMGQVDYCAANAFLDAYAHYNTSMRGIPTISINWDAWQEVGMAVDVAASYGLLESPLAPHKDLAHPLLDARIQETTDEEIYLTSFSPANHWVLAEHRIMGIPALPGTTYLEMVRAAFQQRAAGGMIELREVFFLTPLMIGMDEHKEVHTILEGDGDIVEFRVVSRSAPKDGTEPVWQEHARGLVAKIDSVPSPQHSIEDIRAACGGDEIAISVEDVKQMERFIQWGPRWMSLKRATVAANEGLAFLELPDAFSADLEAFGLHPAILDVATAFGNGFAGRDEAYLPLSYKRVQVYAPLGQRLYSYVRYRADDASQRETISFDITLLDEQGQVLVDIESFTMRRVGDAVDRLRESAMQESGVAEGALPEPAHDHAALNGDRPDAPDLPAKTTSPMIGLLSSEGVNAFKRILSRNKLPQIIVSTKDLHAAIERANTIKQTRILEELEKARAHKPAHPRPELHTAYVAPRNEIERSIAQIWQSVLGIESVGIYDNFFELGGDSVLAIQVIAKFSVIGVQITPAQLFQYQTIAELAAEVGVEQVIVADQGPLVGTIPLTPIQHWFLEQSPTDAHGWTQTLLLEVADTLDPIALEQAVQAVVAHHDALRLRFMPVEDRYEQICAEVEEHLIFSNVNLADMTPAEQAHAMTAATELYTSLNLAEGPLVQVALFHLGAEQPDCLLLIIHHLAADAASLRILLEDLWTAYEQASQSTAIQLPLKTTSFKRWAEKLVESAKSAALQQELGYWLTLPHERIVPLPLDAPTVGASNGVEAARTLTVALDADATRELLEELPVSYIQPEDVLLTALAETFAQWTGERTLFVDLESSGREESFDAPDLSRTVGGFDIRFPMFLDLSTAFGPAETLKTIKEQRSAIPNRGMGYGLLRYLGSTASNVAQLRAQPQAEVRFSYLDLALVPESTPFRLAPQAGGPNTSPSSRRRYLLEIDAWIAENQLRIEWTYNPHVHEHALIARLAQDFLAVLQDLIVNCQSSDIGGYSPSDFPEAGMSQEELDKFMINLQKRAQ